jgi:8-oxo-dGTP pyrophosphatase MutT (NUDIX family)
MRSDDPRRPLVAWLGAHATGDLDPHEAAMTAATLAFVQKEPRCAERALATGHLTGSAWVVDESHRLTLLTHHRKLGKWLQLGGHADGDLDLAAVAEREAREESGLRSLRLAAAQLFDVDRHWIPARGAEPAHWHYDLRFVFVADPAEALVVTAESKELAWVEMSRVIDLNPEESMARMVRKTRAK